MQPDQAWSAAAPWEQAGRAQWWWPEQQQQQYQPARSLQQQLQHAPSVPVPLPPAPQQQQAWQGQMQRSPAELAFLKGEYETALQLSCGDDPPRPDSGWPRVSRERIHGFSALQRECFLQLLLRYGVPEAAEAAPGLDWAPLCRRMPGKDPADVAQYGELLLDKLAALTGAPGASAAQLPAQLRPLLFGRHDAADVVQRIGVLHVLRGALADLGQPEGTTAATLAHQVLRQGCTNWTPFNDVRLLQGVAMHGYSAPDILADASLGLQAPLADELNTAGLPGTSGAGAAAADGTEQQRLQQQWLEERMQKLAAALGHAAQAAAQPPQPARLAAGGQAPADGASGSGQPAPGMVVLHGRTVFVIPHLARLVQQQAQQQALAQQQQQAQAQLVDLEGLREGVKRTLPPLPQSLAPDSRRRRVELHAGAFILNALADGIRQDYAALQRAVVQGSADTAAISLRLQQRVQDMRRASATMQRVLGEELQALRPGAAALQAADDGSRRCGSGG